MNQFVISVSFTLLLLSLNVCADFDPKKYQWYQWLYAPIDIYAVLEGGSPTISGELLQDAFTEMFSKPPKVIPNEDCVEKKFDRWLDLFNKNGLFDKMSPKELQGIANYPCVSPGNYANYDASMYECVKIEGGDINKCHEFIISGGVLKRTTNSCIGKSSESSNVPFEYRRYREIMNCPPCPKIYSYNKTENYKYGDAEFAKREYTFDVDNFSNWEVQSPEDIREDFICYI